MSQQGGKLAECGPVDQARLDRVEMRQFQAGNQFGVERRRVHNAMVAATVVGTEHQTQEAAGFPSVQTLEGIGAKALVLEGMRIAGMNHGQMCAYIGNRKGGPYDQSQWTKALDSGDLPWDRMLVNLPLDFWRPVIARMQQAAGMRVDHGDIADIAILSIGAALQMVGQALQQKAG